MEERIRKECIKKMRERERKTCSSWPLEVGRGCIEEAESTSSVGRGTAGLLLIKGMLLLLYGTIGAVTLAEGEGPGEAACRGLL